MNNQFELPEFFFDSVHVDLQYENSQHFYFWVCGTCVCLARGGMGGVEGECVTGLDLGFTNPGGTGRNAICG